MESRQIDGSSLDLLIVNYQQSIETFDNSISNYLTALDDAATMDCTGHPELFRAALEGARESRGVVIKQSSAIKELTDNSLKTTFDLLRHRIEVDLDGGQQ